MKEKDLERRQNTLYTSHQHKRRRQGNAEARKICHAKHSRSERQKAFVTETNDFSLLGYSELINWW